VRIGRIESAWGAEALRPAVGWKVWRVDDRARLRSVLYGDLWPLEEPVRATCRRLVHSSHQAPARGCECGIHAGRELGAWDHYLAIDAESRVFGRVLLWGSTLEGTHGWRAAEARPVEIFVPPAVTNQEEVAEGLRAYGVAVHVLTPVREEVLVR
jgi:F0F1-type ATP synthase alpha subunit